MGISDGISEAPDVKSELRTGWEPYMLEALKEADKSRKEGGYGIGAVLVLNGEIINRARALTHKTGDPFRHCETDLLDGIRGTEYYADENFRKMAIVTTLESCPMCYSKALIGKVGTIVYGMKDELSGFTPPPEWIPEIFRPNMPKVIGGVLEKECREMFEGNRETLDVKYQSGELFSRSKEKV